MNAVIAAHSILVLEDDNDLRDLLAERLERDGYVVTATASAEQAQAAIQSRGLPHLALVDINLPGRNGLEFCRTLHSRSDLPVILLTAVDDSDTIVRALGECAEDYVVKPFRLNEVVARVQRLLRRLPPGPANARFLLEGGVAFDAATGRLAGGEASVFLTPTECKLLHILAAQGGGSVSTRLIVRRLWPEDATPEETLRVHISRLRAKLRLVAPGVTLLETQRSIGYRLRTMPVGAIEQN